MTNILDNLIGEVFTMNLMEGNKDFCVAMDNANERVKCYRELILKICLKHGISGRDLLEIDDALNDIENIRDEVFFTYGFKEGMTLFLS